VEALSDNSRVKSSNESSHRTGEGVVIDIGTGDGRFVSAAARANPNKFYIGVDANAKPLGKPSMKATRKPAQGGLRNAMFVQAAIEDLPEELNGVADEIHIHFPWGSLLKGVATGDLEILKSLRRISAEGCLLEIVVGIDPEHDRSALERHDIPELTPILLHSYIVPKYLSAGFQLLENRKLKREEWSRLETSWAKKLSSNTNRAVSYVLFEAN
jgi:16S rRNA (adenine(1408)-N(1))-methyltransferase